MKKIGIKKFAGTVGWEKTKYVLKIGEIGRNGFFVAVGRNRLQKMGLIFGSEIQGDPFKMSHPTKFDE